MYTSLDKLKTRMPEKDILELTDDAVTGEIDEAIVNQAIADAESEINSKLRGRYTTPLTSPVPDVVEWIACMLTANKLYSRRHALVLSDGLARELKAARETLRDLQTGDQILEGFENSTSHPGFIKVNKTVADRMFSKPVLQSF